MSSVRGWPSVASGSGPYVKLHESAAGASASATMTCKKARGRGGGGDDALVRRAEVEDRLAVEVEVHVEHLVLLGLDRVGVDALAGDRDLAVVRLCERAACRRQ